MRSQFSGSILAALFSAGFAFAQAKPEAESWQPPNPATTPAVTPAPSTTPLPDSPKQWTQTAPMSDSAFYSLHEPRTSIFTVDAEYLLWFPASSTSSAPLAINPAAGVLVQSGSGIRSTEGPVSGGRFTFGYWTIEENPWIPAGINDMGIEGVFMFLGTQSKSAKDQTTPAIVRPFFDLNNRTQSGFLVAFPGIATGGVTAHTEGSLWGAEVNAWKNVYSDFPGTRLSVQMMAGFRYIDLEERLSVNSVSVYNQNITVPAFASFAGNTLRVSDSFAARNQFYGGQFGIASRYVPVDCLYVDITAKLALGATSENLNIAGAQQRIFADGSQAGFNSGVLALASNSGSHNRMKFAQVPEIDVKFSSPLSRWLTVSFGFSTMYWSRVIRPASQVDRTIDVTQIPNFPVPAGTVPTGLGQPSVPFNQSDLWLLGINVGGEIRW